MIRIFIGASANNEDLECQAVVEYSLRKHHPADDLDITWMRLSRDPQSFWFADPQKKLGWRTETWATPFTALRWGIPAFCNFEGKAIYMDLDKIVLADIAELWTQPFQKGFAMISKPEAICVSLYDCAAMKPHLPPIDQIKGKQGFFRDIRKRFSKGGSHVNIVQRYRGNWNCLDCKRDGGGEYKTATDPDIKILHFTEISTQPHLRHAMPRLKREGIKHWYNKATPIHDHPRKDALKLFDTMLAEATAAGYGIERYRVEPFGDYGR